MTAVLLSIALKGLQGALAELHASAARIEELLMRQSVAEERQAELETRVEQARRLETMGLLAGGMTHDVNNMLTVILATSSVLKQQLPATSSSQELVGEISEAARRAATLNRRLLAVRPEERWDTVDMNRVVCGLQPLLARLVEMR